MTPAAESKYFEILQKWIESDIEVVTFLHNTKLESTAQTILNDGFNFQSHLDFTTDVVTAKDPVTIRYFSLVRHAYGSYTIIIQISKAIIEHYSKLLENLPHHFSEVLTTKPPVLNLEDDYIFNLAPNFVKGYVDSEKSVFIINPKFNPELIIPYFNENLQKILRNNPT